MVHGISEIVDYLLARSQPGGEAEKSPPGRWGEDGRKTGRPDQARGWEAPAAPGPGLSPATIINLISQDMLREEELDLFFPAPPVEMPGLANHRLAVMPTPGLQPLILTVYYRPNSGLNIDQPRYVVDNDVWVAERAQFWSLISVVVGNGDEARCLMETFISRLGFKSSFEVRREGERLSVRRVRCH